jgi:catechol 2,3-dioxygenase-like lactoylglutathione lyase family enzyme
VHEVGAIGLTVGNLDRTAKFFTDVLSFTPAGEREKHGADLETLTGVFGARTRSLDLKLGGERVTLTEWLTPTGRPIPPDSRSFDHWFQHIAIVVSDMDKAYEHLRRHQIRHVSTGPQTLPAWNKDAGGIKAFYFRDPEDHVLEVIWFPPGKGDPKWQQPTDNLFLGIDHTAIVVSDTERSLAFYRDALGMKVAGGAENYGTEQEHLNQVFGARLRITALRAAKGPGIELLEYLTPPGGRPLPPDAGANDRWFWRTELRVDDLASPGRSDRGARLISPGAVNHQLLLRDPDGHALHLFQGTNEATLSRN